MRHSAPTLGAEHLREWRSPLSHHSFPIPTIPTMTAGTPPSPTHLFPGWCHGVHAPHPTLQHSKMCCKQPKPTPPCLPPVPEWGPPHRLALTGRGEPCARGVAPRYLLHPDQEAKSLIREGLPQSSPVFANWGKSMDYEMSKVGLGGGGSGGTSVQNILPPQISGTSEK